jgi:plastocyanin
MRTLLTTIGTTLLVAASSVFLLGGSTSGATEPVDAQDFAFSPPTINITAGDTVRWEFVGEAVHNVTAADESFASADLSSGTYERTFNSAGTYAYYCSFHGNKQGQGMAGTVVVAAAPTATHTPQNTATREPTDTPEATSTAAPTNTAAPGATATPVEVVPISAPAEASSTPGGGAQPALTAPTAGGGAGDRESPYWLPALLAVAGAGFIGGALAFAKRRYS